MSEFLAAAAEKLGAPEELVERSARARATAQGVDVDSILSAWAGGAAAPAPAATPPPTPEPAGAEPTPADDGPPDATPAPTPAPVAAPPAPAPAAPAPAAPAAVATARPVPERVSPAEAAGFDVVTTVAASSLKERTVSTLPRWLTLLFMILPLAGLTYLVTFSGGPECGSSGQLAVDRIGGIVVGCDGALFGGAGFGDGPNPRDIVATGSGVYSQCSSCHGADGGGGAGFPVLSGGAVVSTFSSCADHIEWVRLGSSGYQAAGRSTYGDDAKPVGGGGQMPGFATLSEDDLRAVVFFERVTFGGENPGEALANCGYIEPEGEAPAEGEEPTEGAEPAEGDTEALGTNGS